MNSLKSAAITAASGLGLLVPAAIGLNDNGPTILGPLPALTVLPALALASWDRHIWKAAMAVPMLLFFFWLPGLFHGEDKIPKRSYALLAIATVLSVLWFIAGWKYGLDYQGARFTYTVGIVNLAVVSSLAVAFLKIRKGKSSFKTSLILHWILFAWLAWYAFPWLGEML